jgi:hypothetical protein
MSVGTQGCQLKKTGKINYNLDLMDYECVFDLLRFQVHVVWAQVLSRQSNRETPFDIHPYSQYGLNQSSSVSHP